MPIDMFDTTTAYRQVLQSLTGAGLPFLVGGSFAFTRHTGIERSTKDLDLFVRPADYGATTQCLQGKGFGSELTYPHWLGKVHAGPVCVDLIFNSGNGLSEVDDLWFSHAHDADVLGVPVKIVPVEEMIWSKAFIMERERYDGADVAHMFREQAHALDWDRLLDRVGPHWRVLLSHLVLFGFIYPAERARVPAPLMRLLLERARAEIEAPAPPQRVCCGTLLSREQYLDDIERRGYLDARMTPLSTMTPDDVSAWTEAIPPRAGASTAHVAEVGGAQTLPADGTARSPQSER